MSMMTATDVAHDDTISSIHISVAKAKMAMMRCWTTVRFWMPYHSAGMFQSNKVIKATNSILSIRVVVASYLRWWRLL